jgi:hypothetical protein
VSLLLRFLEKTGGKSGRSWHVPCFYLLLSIEVIETAGIGPGQNAKPSPAVCGFCASGWSPVNSALDKNGNGND